MLCIWYLIYPNFLSEKGRLETMLERCSSAFKRSVTCIYPRCCPQLDATKLSGGDRRSSKDRLVKFESESQNGATPFA